MDKKALTNIFKNIFTFLIIFLMVQTVFNWINPAATPSTEKTINLLASSNDYHLHDLVEVKLINHTDQAVSFVSKCPSPAVTTEKLVNGNWEEIKVDQKMNCSEIPANYSVAPNQTFVIPTNDWNNALFGSLGNYRFKLTLEGGQTFESNQFQTSGQTFFSWIWLTLFFAPIINALILFTSIIPGNSLGLAIILLTILIRTILLIPNQRAMHYQKKLQTVQPKIAELKEKHGNDQQKIAAETMAIYKEHKVNPLGSCLPILIQLPVLLALYSVIQSGLSPNNNFLLYGSLKNFDLTLIHTNFLGFLELTKVNFTWLPILVGVLQYLQIKLTFAKAKKSGDSATGKKEDSQMAKMNKTMSVMMPVMITIFAASVPAGVGLYWASSTIYAIIQQLIFNKLANKDQTQIKVVGGISKNKLKKQEYQQKIAERKEAEPKVEESPTIIEQKDENEDQTPPITIIKA